MYIYIYFTSIGKTSVICSCLPGRIRPINPPTRGGNFTSEMLIHLFVFVLTKYLKYSPHNPYIDCRKTAHSIRLIQLSQKGIHLDVYFAGRFAIDFEHRYLYKDINTNFGSIIKPFISNQYKVQYLLFVFLAH